MLPTLLLASKAYIAHGDPIDEDGHQELFMF